MLIPLILSFLGNAAALFLVAALFSGITVDNIWSLFWATIIVGVVNTLIRPIAQIISLPITVVTLGIFALVVNAAMFGLAAWLVPGFSIDGFWPAFWGALVLSLVSTVLNSILFSSTHPK